MRVHGIAAAGRARDRSRPTGRPHTFALPGTVRLRVAFLVNSRVDSFCQDRLQKKVNFSAVQSPTVPFTSIC